MMNQSRAQGFGVNAKSVTIVSWNCFKTDIINKWDPFLWVGQRMQQMLLVILRGFSLKNKCMKFGLLSYNDI